MAIILGLCARLEDTGLADHQRADVQRLRAQAGVIAAAAGSLLTSHGAAATPPAEIDAAVIARGIVADLSVLARGRGTQLIVGTPAAAFVRDPGGRLRAAITNLVTNALRQVGEQGVVRCSVAVAGGAVCIEVADSGPGLPAKERDAVLLPFAQGSGARGKAGLGLSIVHDAASALGGALQVGEAAEGGASFRLTIPAARVTARSQAQSS